MPLSDASHSKHAIPIPSRELQRKGKASPPSSDPAHSTLPGQAHNTPTPWHGHSSPKQEDDSQTKSTSHQPSSDPAHFTSPRSSPPHASSDGVAIPACSKELSAATPLVCRNSSPQIHAHRVAMPALATHIQLLTHHAPTAHSVLLFPTNRLAPRYCSANIPHHSRTALNSAFT